MEATEKVKKKGLKNWKNWARAIVIGIFLGGQLTYCVDEVWTKPSKIKQDFFKEFGIKLEGRDSVIAEDLSKLTKLACVIDKERLEKKFEVKAIRLVGRNFLVEPFYKAQFVSFPCFGGVYDKSTKVIYINHANISSPRQLSHEIKHVKSYDVKAENPKFEEEFEKISGKKAYRNFWERCIYKATLIDDLFSGGKRKEVDGQGFVTEYSKNYVWEDIAELASISEFRQDYIANKLYRDKDTVLNKKIECLQKYGLLPKEYLEYSKLHYERNFVALEDGSYVNRVKRFNKLCENVKEFFKKYPNSVYCSEVYTLLVGLVNKKDRLKIDMEANLLNFRHKNYSSYKVIVNNCVFSLDEVIHKIEKKKALGILKDKYFAGDVTLPRVGINEYLDGKKLALKKKAGSK